MAEKGYITLEEYIELDRQRAKIIKIYSLTSAIVAAIVLTLI